MIKKRFLTILSAMVVLFCYSAAVSAQTPGYALYGDVPYGYTDLTSNVTASAQGSVTKDADAPLTFTGKGLSGSQYCGTGNYLRLAFNAAQQMSLTSDFALHILIKKAETATGDVQICLCKNGWNANRIPWLIANSAISSSEYSEIVLKYADRNTSISWNSYGDGNLIGTNVNFEANEMMRICAANGEQFMIDKIFLEATYTEPTPGPGPEPEPVAEKRYYFVRGGDLPVIDGVTMVDLRAPDNAAWSVNQFSNLTNNENGVQFTLPGGWGVAELKPKAQALADVTKAGWHLKMKFETDATHLNGKNLRINIGSNGGNGNLYLSEASYVGVQEMTFALADAANTMTFPVAANNQMFQLHANGGLGGTYFKVIYAYLTNDPSSDEAPVITGDEEAPTNVTAAVKAGSVSYNEATLTLSAEDESAPITFNLWNADKTAKVATASAASGVAKDVTLNGLTPETSYTYYVEAVDNAGNATEQASWVEVSFTTTKLAEKRYYFFRGGDLPENTADLTCVDLRKGHGTNITLGNGATLTEKMYWTKIVTSNSWWSFNQNLSAAQDMSDVNYTEWYMKVKFRTNITNNDFNIRLLEQICWQVSQHNLDITTDGEWNELTLSLSDAKGSHPAFGSFGAGKTILQFNSNCTSGLFVDIEYAYLTNNQDAEDGYADHTAPTDFTAVAGTVTSTTAELLLQATDDSGEDVEYVITSGLDTWNVTGASGVQISKTITDLTEASYTFSVVAKDHAGNAVATPIEVEVTMQAEDVTAPADLTVTQGEVTLHSIELLLQATDENGMDIIYDITMDGELLASPVGASEQQISYVVSGLEIGSVHNFSVVARDLDGNTSEAVELNDVATTSLKSCAFSIFAKTLDMYNYVDHKAGEELKTTMTLHMVEYKNKLYFAQLGDGKGLSNGTWNNQVWIWNAAETTRVQELAAQVLSNNKVVRYTEAGINLNNTVGQEFRFNMYANGVFGFNEALNSQMQHFVRGYVNTPSSDESAPGFWGDITVTDDVVTGKRTLTIKQFGEASEWDVFYYVKEGENEYISLAKEVEVPFLKTEATYECYVIDWNGNMSAAKQVVHAPKAVISDGNELQNATMAAFYDGVTVDVELTRNLSSAYYNTICLPFSMSAAQVEAAFGAGCVISELTQAYIKTNDELYLGFTDVDEIEAGKPYLIQPAANVSGAKTIENVTFSKDLNSSEFSSVVGFYGVIDTQTLPGDNTYIMLVANNQLAFPNGEGSIRPLRAYFRMLGATPAKVRSARIGQATQTPTDILEGEQAATTAKMIRNGQLIIVRDNKEYNVMGQVMQ